MNLQTKKIKLKIVKRFRKYSFRALICIVVILLIGFSYEKNANNHKINVYNEGKGNVTVVFSSSEITPSTYADMYSLYNEISKYTNQKPFWKTVI